ncbi:hypothetical protein ACIFOT_22865 [Neobacillus sp. NRS-1170]|uniref:hypothetical protein n=1 Tax=Neobacillus sp. NRS-1170 TaxID=3233898 RepID=UPI003D2C9E81
MTPAISIFIDTIFKSALIRNGRHHPIFHEEHLPLPIAEPPVASLKRFQLQSHNIKPTRNNHIFLPIFNIAVIT